MKNIVSLFDHSGVWSDPYRDAGYAVMQVDLKHGMDVMLLDDDDMPARVHGVLAAPPCTDFTISGSRWWAAKDRDGRTEASLELVRKTLSLIKGANPIWWALENPVGRLARLLPELGKPKLVWQPWWYGNAYTKRTCLWGHFCANLRRTPVEPVMYETTNGKRGSYMWAKLGGKSDRTKELRSITPPGFAKAFFEVNP